MQGSGWKGIGGACPWEPGTLLLPVAVPWWWGWSHGRARAASGGVLVLPLAAAAGGASSSPSLLAECACDAGAWGAAADSSRRIHQDKKDSRGSRFTQDCSHTHTLALDAMGGQADASDSEDQKKPTESASHRRRSSLAAAAPRLGPCAMWSLFDPRRRPGPLAGVFVIRLPAPRINAVKGTAVV